MTLGRQTSRGRDDLPGLPATTDFPDHPTLVEIAQRQTQIEVWEALSVGGYRFAKPGTVISFLLIVISVFLIVSPGTAELAVERTPVYRDHLRSSGDGGMRPFVA